MLSHYLVIDTATDYLFVSLVHNKEIIYEYLQKGSKDHAIKLMPIIQEALKTTSLKNLDGIVVGIGPGSYTGVRIGVVVAKMLAKESGIPLYKVSSLILKASSNEGLVGSIIDARRNHVFAGIYDFSKNEVVIKKDTYISLDDFKNEINQQAIDDTFKPDVLKLNAKNLFENVDNIDALTPQYLRKTQAENERNDS